MLETRNLKKVYKTKKGVAVTALKGVSLKFPDRGMVFLLGKSGSGKSTLLNLLGGLDQYSDGEIIIKGQSSKDFKQGHFDSYRNTYVGFIFQEYNVLEEFTVGANIALAIELQGRKATDEELNQILAQVDLAGFGDRKPNELSGGQKQRVAIARALVKNPQIIMADEPTGALDSATGRQVLDTLKKLSEDKLVIVVSHDREFAQQYGDRIIELADGEVIRDVERVVKNRDAAGEIATGQVGKQNTGEGKQETAQRTAGIAYEEDTLIIPAGYHLTEEDRRQINDYLQGKKTTVTAKIKKVTGDNFAETDQKKIVHGTGDFQLIQSKLPLKNAFKIGGSSLKHKKIRLAITILLSFVAFTLFALSDTFSSYNHVKTCTNSITDTGITYASVTKSIKHGEGMGAYWSEWENKLTGAEIDKLKQDTGYDFQGVYIPGSYESLDMGNYDNVERLSENDEYSHYAYEFSGFAEISKEDLQKMGYEILAGDLPDGSKDEVAISKYVYETYAKAGYVKNGDKLNIQSFKDLIGQSITIGNKEYTVTGIVDTHVDMERYASLSESMVGQSSAESLVTYALSRELRYIQQFSMACVAMVGPGRVEQMIAESPQMMEMNNFNMNLYNEKQDIYAESWNITKLSQIDPSQVTWIDDEKTTLGDKEILVDATAFFRNDKEMSKEQVLDYLKENNDFTLSTVKWTESEEHNVEEGWKVVGLVNTDDDAEAGYVLPDAVYDQGWDEGQGDYVYAVTSMPKDKTDVQKLVSYCYEPKGNLKYQMRSPVTYELDSVNEVLKILAKGFLYVGIGFAVFAMLMLSNFIATSIAYKKQEIGILRAIGARSHDVFRIFFSESFIIAMVNFVLACAATYGATTLINRVIRTHAGILITVLNFGLRQIVLLFVISVLVAAVASFIPVYKIASKKPIEAIRNK